MDPDDLAQFRSVGDKIRDRLSEKEKEEMRRQLRAAQDFAAKFLVAGDAGSGA